MNEANKAQRASDNIPEESPGNEVTRLEMMILWTGLLTGPALWFVQQQLSFVLVPWICAHGGVAWLHGVTLLCLAGTTAVGMLAWRYRHPEHNDWQRGGLATSEVIRPPAPQTRSADAMEADEPSSETAKGGPPAGEQRVRFMAVLGILSSVFFALVIIAQGIPNLLLDPCRR